MSTNGLPTQEHARVGTKYRTYKRATDKLAGWLASTAKSLGFGEGGGIKIAQFTTLTDVIVKAEPKIEIPHEIMGLAETAFHFRLERANLLKGVDLESDTRHRFVISIIAEVVEKLRSHVKAFKVGIKSVPKCTAENGLVPSFEVLDLDPLGSSGSDDEKEAAPQIQMSNKNKKRKAQKKKRKLKEGAKDVFVIEDEDEDPYFVLMCLLSDLKSIREYLKEVWREYKDGRLGLVTASVTTNAAFDVIKTYLEDCPAMSSLLDNYSQTMKMLISRNIDKSSTDQLALALTSSAPCDPDVKEIAAMGEALANIEEVADLTLASPFYFLSSLQDVFSSRMGASEHDQFGEYHPEQDRSKMNAGEKLQEDFQILNYFASGFYNIEEMHHYGSPTLDQLTLDWDVTPQNDIVKGEYVSLTETLSAQIILDIHHILRQDAWHGFRQLYEFSKKMDVSITRWKQDTGNNFFRAKYKERTFQMDENTNKEHGLVKLLIDRYESTVGIALEDGLESSDIMHSSYMAINPVLCGTFLFQMMTEMREGGWMTAAFWKSIQSAGQLYYSCQMHRQFAKEAAANKLGTDTRIDCQKTLQWDDMDYLFEVYGVDAFFHDHIPQSNDEIVKHVGTHEDYLITLGLVLSRPNMENVKKGYAHFILDNIDDVCNERGIGRYGPINVSYNLYYYKYVNLILPKARGAVCGMSYWKLETLQALLEGHLANNLRLNASRSVMKIGGKKKKSALRTTLKGSDGNISQVSILRTLKETLQSESRVLNFDFLSFHLTCRLLLRAIRRVGLPTFEALNGGKLSGKASYAGDDDYPDKMRDIITIIHRPEAIPLQGPSSTNKGHIEIDSIIRQFLTENKCKDRQVKKVDSIWGIAPS